MNEQPVMRIEITGKQGVGKTRLAREIAKVLASWDIETMIDDNEMSGPSAREPRGIATIVTGYPVADVPVRITTTELGLPMRGTDINEWIDDQIYRQAFTCNNQGVVTMQQAAEIARGATLQVISDRAALINNLVRECHGAATRNGWWNDLKTGESLLGKRNIPEMLCLIHSEVSEALEGHRKNLMDTHLPHRRMLEVELVDILIRVFDLAGSEGMDLGGGYVEKRAYNDVRADHKPEARLAADGKAF